MSGFSLVKTFADAAGAPERRSKRKAPPPFSIRFTDEERARLNRAAGKLSLSAYIRQRLFGEAAAARKPGYRRKQRRPAMDQQTLARLLAALGHSELARSMIALAMAAQSGALPVAPDLSQKLDAACDDIRDMRTALIVALNIKPESGGCSASED